MLVYIIIIIIKIIYKSINYLNIVEIELVYEFYYIQYSLDLFGHNLVDPD